MEIQFDTYWKYPGVSLLYVEAERRYVTSARLLQVRTELLKAIEQHDQKYYDEKESPVREGLIKSFDHRVLQSAYDWIAAWFRFCRTDLNLPLFRNDAVVAEVNKNAWQEFWASEVRRLVQFDEITVAVVTAVAFQNGERGLRAEGELAEFLRSQYPGLFAMMDPYLARFLRKYDEVPQTQSGVPPC